jgi:hypothetical protein
MNSRYPDVAERAGHRCEYCHAPEAVFNLPFEVEHVAPIARGGRDIESNLALACRSCNLYKSTITHGIDPETDKTARLYHPRLDVWEEHFQVQSETGEVTGKSAIGRVTIICLHMNSDAQMYARRQWVKIGLYP